MSSTVCSGSQSGPVQLRSLQQRGCSFSLLKFTKAYVDSSTVQDVLHSYRFLCSLMLAHSVTVSLFKHRNSLLLLFILYLLKPLKNMIYKCLWLVGNSQIHV